MIEYLTSATYFSAFAGLSIILYMTFGRKGRDR